jgi:hypothetical protein
LFAIVSSIHDGDDDEDGENENENDDDDISRGYLSFRFHLYTFTLHVQFDDERVLIPDFCDDLGYSQSNVLSPYGRGNIPYLIQRRPTHEKTMRT